MNTEKLVVTGAVIGLVSMTNTLLRLDRLI